MVIKRKIIIARHALLARVIHALRHSSPSVRLVIKNADVRTVKKTRFHRSQMLPDLCRGQRSRCLSPCLPLHRWSSSRSRRSSATHSNHDRNVHRTLTVTLAPSATLVLKNQNHKILARAVRVGGKRNAEKVKVEIKRGSRTMI